MRGKALVWRRGVAGAAAISLVLLVAGCSALDPKPNPPGFGDVEDALPEARRAYTFDYSLAYLMVAQDGLLDFSDRPSRIRSLASLGVLGGGIGAAVAALLEANASYILGAGLVGASSFALGNLYGEQVFEEIYDEGYAALLCVEEAAAPLLIAGTAVRVARSQVQQARAELDRQLKKAGLQATVAAEAEALAQAALEESETIGATEISAASATIAAVKRIYAQVRSAIRRSDNRLQNAANGVSNISTFASRAQKVEPRGAAAFADLPDGLKALTATARREQALVEAYAAWTAAVNRLVDANRALAALSQRDLDLTQCNMRSVVATPPQLVSPEIVDGVVPVTLRGTDPASVTLVLKGGQPNYVPVGDLPEGVRVEGGFGSFVVTFTDGLFPAGAPETRDMTLLFMDFAAQVLSVVFRVAKEAS